MIDFEFFNDILCYGFEIIRKATQKQRDSLLNYLYPFVKDMDNTTFMSYYRILRSLKYKNLDDLRIPPIELHDEDGFNIYSVNIYTNTIFDKDGYDIRGYNREGYDREGYDEAGYNRNGIDAEGKHR